MATTLEARVQRGDGIATVALTGDVDGGAREALDAAYAEAAGAATLLLDFGDVDYINSTGIALIVGLLGRARADGVAGRRLRAVRPLPRDLRDHPAVRLHVHPRRRAAALARPTQGGAR